MQNSDFTCFGSSPERGRVVSVGITYKGEPGDPLPESHSSPQSQLATPEKVKLDKGPECPWTSLLFPVKGETLTFPCLPLFQDAINEKILKQKNLVIFYSKYTKNFFYTNRLFIVYLKFKSSWASGVFIC